MTAVKEDRSIQDLSIKVQELDRPWDQIHVWITAHDCVMGSPSIIARGFDWTLFKMGDPIHAFPLDRGSAQDLMNDLWKCGLRPTEEKEKCVPVEDHWASWLRAELKCQEARIGNLEGVMATMRDALENWLCSRKKGESE